MKVLYIHQYFKTPAEGGSLRSYYLSKELVKRGIQVTMITACNDYKRRTAKIDGIEVVYLPVFYQNELSFKKRSLAYLKFMLLAMIESMRHKKIDLCYVMTTPLSTGIIALFNKYLLRRPYIFEVGDLWPKVPIDMGLLTGKWKQKLLMALEKTFYKNAQGLVGLSEPISNHMRGFVSNIPVDTVYNISDIQNFKRSPKQKILEKKYGVEGQLVLSYTGTFGMANDLKQIIDFAKEVKDLPIEFLMVGEGVEKDSLVNSISSSKVSNIQVFDQMSKSELQEIVNISDAMLVSFASYDSLHTGSPNKFFDALAAGKLVVTNFHGWIGEMIEQEQCGMSVNSKEEFKTQIIDFLNKPELLESYQDNARKLAEEKFDLKLQAQKQFEFINECLN